MITTFSAKNPFSISQQKFQNRMWKINLFFGKFLLEAV